MVINWLKILYMVIRGSLIETKPKIDRITSEDFGVRHLYSKFNVNDLLFFSIFGENRIPRFYLNNE